MKYAMVIMDGAADEALDALEGKTPLEAAQTPALDDIAQSGRIGLVATAPVDAPVEHAICATAAIGFNPFTELDGAAKSFRDRFDVSACVVTDQDDVAEICARHGVDRVQASGAGEGSPFRAMGDAAIKALDKHELVIVWAGGPGDASAAGDVDQKISAIERIDAAIVRPLLDHLQTFGDAEEDRLQAAGAGWRMLAMADRTAEVETRESTHAPPPFAMAGSWVRSVVEHPFDERHARGSDLFIDRGHDLMEYFLYSAMRRPRVRRRAAKTETARERA